MGEHRMAAWSTTFLPEESLKQRLKKAAHVAPSPAQLAWMRRGYIAFLHYSPNTFTNRQWGNGTETPADFCPDRQERAFPGRDDRSGENRDLPQLGHADAVRLRPVFEPYTGNGGYESL